jgi:hypothetical protein
MRTSVLSLGAMALGLVSAHEYPNCEDDNCYRNLVDQRFAEEAVAWCPEFLASTTTDASAIPTNFNNCEGNIKAVSSACSCITYTASATATPTSSEVPETTETEVPETTTTTEVPETTETEVPETTTTATETDDDDEECTSTSTTKWTTSTITTTTTRTITSCSAAVTDCPGGGVPTVTTEVIVTTTVCPVTDEPEVPTPTGSFISSNLPTLLPTLTTARNTTFPPKPTSSGPATAGAGRVVGGGIAAVAGLFAAFL